MAEDIYTKKGYTSRADYLRCLADEYGVDVCLVHYMSEMLGPSEDFDGLINALEDETI